MLSTLVLIMELGDELGDVVENMHFGFGGGRNGEFRGGAKIASIPR